MAYSDKVVDHYENPRNVGSLNPTNNNVGTGLVGAPECGDVMKLQIQVENDRIVDAKFKALYRFFRFFKLGILDITFKSAP